MEIVVGREHFLMRPSGADRRSAKKEGRRSNVG